MKVAVEGCSHGELDKIYAAIQHAENKFNFKVDLLLCCGDFQSVRNKEDLESMAVPPKYRRLQDFHHYYSGTKTAPILTVFIGGNHEASSYLSELPYGGWVCPNIYYMGYANVIQIGGIRIAGLSGIYKGHDYLKGHFEIPPYNESTKRSAYHIRNIDVFRLKQISQPIDIFMSHDWPRGIYHHGNVKQLLKRKPFFTNEIENNTLGSRPAEELLSKVQPRYWFSAHLHTKFAALVKHEKTSKSTRFLALDKCLPKRQFLQILDIQPTTAADSIELDLKYDAEWLSILRSTNHLLTVSSIANYMPGPQCDKRWDFTPTEEETKSTMELFEGSLNVPLNFVRTAEPHNMSAEKSLSASGCQPRINPQTTAFCQRLGIDDPVSRLTGNSTPTKPHLSVASFLSLPPPSPINHSEADVTLDDNERTFVSRSSINPDEISLSDDDDDDDDEDEEDEEEGAEVDESKENKADEEEEEEEEEKSSGSGSLSPDDGCCAVTSTSVSAGSLQGTEDGEEQEELPSSSDAVALPFFIDRKGSRSEGASGESVSSFSGLLLGDSEGRQSEADGGESLSSSDVSSSSRKRGASSAAKTLKRRNYAIYARQDDEDDNDDTS